MSMCSFISPDILSKKLFIDISSVVNIPSDSENLILTNIKFDSLVGDIFFLKTERTTFYYIKKKNGALTRYNTLYYLIDLHTRLIIQGATTRKERTHHS
jgi:hypothetical protein